MADLANNSQRADRVFARRQQDSLRHLVAVMCESGANDILLRYTFVGLHGELEKTLAFRARNSHPLDSSVDYYKVLFAFHTTRSDYRAGELSEVC